MLLLMAMGARHAALVTVGTDTVLYGYFTGLFGSISDATFGGKTIAAVHWNISATGAVGLRFVGTSVPNTDATFVSVRIGTLGTFLRSAASYTADDGLGNTTFGWSADTSGYPTSGSIGIAVQ